MANKLELQPADPDFEQLVLAVSLIGILAQSGILRSAVLQAKQLAAKQRGSITQQAGLQRLEAYLETPAAVADLNELVALISPLPFTEAIKAKILALNIFPGVLPQVTPEVINGYMAQLAKPKSNLIITGGDNGTKH